MFRSIYKVLYVSNRIKLHRPVFGIKIDPSLSVFMNYIGLYICMGSGKTSTKISDEQLSLCPHLQNFNQYYLVFNL